MGIFSRFARGDAAASPDQASLLERAGVARPPSDVSRETWTRGTGDLDHVGTIAENLHKGTPRKAIMALLEEEGVREMIAADDVPLPPAQQRIPHKNDDVAYWLTGYMHKRDLKGLAERTIGGLPDGPVLDFGSSSGRAARHWAMGPDAREVYGVDITAHEVAWAQKYLAHKVTTYNTREEPPLPFADDTFGVVYAHSVFTHIDEFEAAWLAELARVTRPGGMLMLTIHDDHVWNRLPIMDWSLGTIMREISGFDELTREGATRPDRVVHKDMVFMSHDRVRRVWGRWFEVVEIVPAFHAYQAAVVLRPKN